MDPRDLERPIEPDHEYMLRTMLNLQDDGLSLPEGVVDAYWRVARTARRIGHPVTPELLVLCVCFTGYDPPAPEMSTYEQLERRGASPGDKVLVNFRNKWQWASFVSLHENDKRIVAVIDDGNAEERKFRPNSVRIPTSEELKTIGA